LWVHRDVHLRVLRSLADVEVVAVCDPHRTRAERLAKKFAVRSVFGSVHEMLAAGGIDAVHVLVPPGKHAEVAAACLSAGLHVLVEKPLVLCPERRPLGNAGPRAAVRARGQPQPGLPTRRAELQQQLGAARLGRLEHIALQHHVPLRQLQTGDVGHFMFESPANILFEQGVHLFSIVHLLLGPSQRVRALTSEPRLLPHGVPFVDDWQLAIDCERGTASVRMAFGRPLLETTLQAIGSDGAALLDLQRGSCWVRHKTRWPDFLDHGCNLGSRFTGSGAARARESGRATRWGCSASAFPDDAFLCGMRGSLRAFHRAVRGQEALPAVMSAAGAAAVITTCIQSARAAGVQIDAPSRPPLPPPGPRGPARSSSSVGPASSGGVVCACCARWAGP
jgi:predicted dehydrogenase